MRIRPVLSNLIDTRPRNRVRERDRNEIPPSVAGRESRETSAHQGPRSNTGHAIVRSHWMGATTAPGRRRAVQRSRFLGEGLRLRACESLHPFQPPPSPRRCWEVHELPSEGTSDASHQMASVSADRSAQGQGMGGAVVAPSRGVEPPRIRRRARQRRAHVDVRFSRVQIAALPRSPRAGPSEAFSASASAGGSLRDRRLRVRIASPEKTAADRIRITSQ
jgi:hypothetical protein